jgi:hypothetical protein
VIERLLIIPCTIVRRAPGAADEYNDPTLDETREAATCYWETTRAGEREDTGATEQSHVTVFLSANAADLDAISAVEITDGPTVEAYGPPRRVFSGLTGLAHHVELLCRVTA